MDSISWEFRKSIIPVDVRKGTSLIPVSESECLNFTSTNKRALLIVLLVTNNVSEDTVLGLVTCRLEREKGCADYDMRLILSKS